MNDERENAGQRKPENEQMSIDGFMNLPDDMELPFD